jgi:hypothetical protein
LASLAVARRVNGGAKREALRAKGCGLKVHGPYVLAVADADDAVGGQDHGRPGAKRAAQRHEYPRGGRRIPLQGV